LVPLLRIQGLLPELEKSLEGEALSEERFLWRALEAAKSCAVVDFEATLPRELCNQQLEAAKHRNVFV
jgi:hypothetical protein